MIWRLIGISLISTIVVVLSLLPTHSDAYITRSTGCYHNGTWYADKSVIPTIEKCLNCQCNRKTLVCRRKVCPEMPMPPPRGCVVVQKKNTCCPYLSCARLESFYKIPVTRRIIAYLDHYERESIDRVVNDNMLQRRSDDSDTDLHVCVKNGTVYKSGSAMSSSNLCSYCYCIGGHEKCVKPKCMLPVEGCKPIFVDSTCCPVRYDCSSKSSGKSSQEVRYRKTANKHFMRMSQRLQRNRGCTVGSTFYAEGQKMKSDPDKPCDICFCIRGSRRCAPKKCAPALKNCIPVVPKGQCCPSSYDCGSQRDYRRAQNSRQFSLFSLLFGKDEEAERNTEIPVQYPHDRHPEITDPNINKFPQLTLMASSEKSIFDTLREGLEFIDANNKQMLAENEDLVAEPSTVAEVPLLASSTTIAPETREGGNSSSTTTEISFLDLLLGPSESNKEQQKEDPDVDSEEEKDSSVTATTSSSTGSSLSWVDLLLGPDEDDEKLPPKLTTTQRPSSSTTTTTTSTTTTAKPSTSSTPPSTTVAATIERIDNDLEEDFLSSGELSVGELPAEAQQQLVNHQQKPAVPTKSPNTSRPTQQTTKATTTSTTAKTTTRRTTRRTTTTTATTRRPTTKKSSTTTTRKPTQRTTPKTTEAPVTKSPATSSSTNKPQSGLLSALFDMLSSESLSNKTNATAAVRTTTVKPKTRPTPQFKPLPSIKPLVRINSKIANLTVQPPPMVSTTKMAQNSTAKPPAAAGKTPQALGSSTTTRKPPTKPSSTTATPTTRQSTTSTTSTTRAPSSSSTTSTTTTSTTTTVTPPLVVKTNPSILEADPIDAEPTLPPSLPNLKIIPFLPTDAVNADIRPKPLYDYYNGNGNGNGANPQHNPISRIDFDLYDDNANAYPSITETFPYYADLEDGSKAEYIYKFNVEAPTAVAVKPAVASVDNVPTNAYVSYNAAAVPASQGVIGSVESVPQANGGFSPPTKTEGGFVPKAPLLLDENSPDALAKLEAENNYHATQHIIDITTSEPLGNTTKVIEFTTPDPFKDVIHTEPPPDLFSLIEDKEKSIVSSKEQQTPTLAENVTTKASVADLQQQLLLPAIELNTTAPQKIVSIPIPPPTKQKNTIESFLDFLLSDEEPETEPLNAALPEELLPSTVPPFKTLPTAKTPLTTGATEVKPITTTTATMWMTSKVTNEISLSSSSTRPPTTTTSSVVKANSKPSRTKTTAPSATATRNKTKTKTNNRQPTKSQPAAGNSAQKRPKPTNQRRVINKPTTTTTTTVTTTQTPATTTKHIQPAQAVSHMPSSTSPALSSTNNPYLMSPFDKLPFMDASYEVKHKPLRPQHLTSAVDTAPNSYNYWENPYVIAGDGGNGDMSAAASPFMLTTVATTTSTTTTSTTQRPQHSSSNSLMDPAGILKLAGCNIYGRMYRVGRIILELSSACLECRCTEVGVKCQQLDC